MSRRKHRNPFQWRKLAVLPTATCLALCMGYASPAIAEEPVQNSETSTAQVSTVEASSPGVDTAAKESPTDKSNKSAFSATTIPAADANSAADEGGSETKPASPAEDVYALVPSESSPHLTWTKNGEPCAASGWKSFEGAWYWFDGSPHAAEARWVSDRGSWYWLGEDGRMAEGTFEAQGSLWHATASGALLTGQGWAWDGAWYRTSPSGALTTGWLWDGAWYWLDPQSGKMAAGWFRDGGGDWYLADGSGRMLTGWQATGGRWYHLAGSGRMDAGWLWDGAWYWLDPEGGAMAVGWAQDGDGAWWYLLGDGTLSGQRWVAGWAGSWYWVDASGRMGSGWLSWGGSWYWLDPETGMMATGLETIGKQDYYFTESGSMAAKQWVPIDDTGKYRFATANGELTANASKTNGELVLLDDSDAPLSGWVKIDGLHFYAKPDSGAMATQWQMIDGNWYWFGGQGAMATGWTSANGSWYLMAQSGEMKTGWQYVDGAWYYLDPSSGAMKTGWLNENGTWYWLSASGAMVTGWQYVDGGFYYFNASGAWDPYADPMTQRAQGYYSATNWLIMIDTVNNEFGVYWGWQGNWKLQYHWSCSTGAWATPTVLGEYTVGIKGYVFGSGFSCYYYTQFYGDYLIHSGEYYQGTFVEMDNRQGVNISHGCVRLTLDRAKWVYDNIPYNTKVVTYMG